jgi:hypothetical protein
MWSLLLPAGTSPALASDTTVHDARRRGGLAADAAPTVQLAAPLAVTPAGLFVSDAQVDALATASTGPRFAFYTVAAEYNV